MKPTWLDKIKTQEDFDSVVSTGMAYVWFKDLPFSWSECLEFKKKYEYYNSVKNDNYQASLQIKDFEEESGFERSYN